LRPKKCLPDGWLAKGTSLVVALVKVTIVQGRLFNLARFPRRSKNAVQSQVCTSAHRHSHSPLTFKSTAQTVPAVHGPSILPCSAQQILVGISGLLRSSVFKQHGLLPQFPIVSLQAPCPFVATTKSPQVPFNDCPPMGQANCRDRDQSFGCVFTYFPLPMATASPLGQGLPDWSTSISCPLSMPQFCNLVVFSPPLCFCPAWFESASYRAWLSRLSLGTLEYLYFSLPFAISAFFTFSILSRVLPGAVALSGPSCPQTSLAF